MADAQRVTSPHDEYPDRGQLVVVRIVLGLDVAVGLHIDPESLAEPERAGETETCIGRDAALAPHNLTDPGLS